MGAPSAQLPIAILGGGLTGLAAAHRLARRGRAFRLFEITPRLGGNLRTERDGEWLYEAGPNSLQLTPAVAALCAELGLTHAAASPAAKNRYIARGGLPRPAPSSVPGFLTTPLFTAPGKLRALGDLFHRPPVRSADISLADFGKEHFGRELVDYGLSPFVSGIYAGDTRALSTRHSFPSLWEAERTHGSVIRGMIAAAKARGTAGHPSGPPPIVSFAEGLETLPRALAAHLPAGSVELSARVTRLQPGPPWSLTWTSPDNAERTETFSRILLALPAAALATLAIGDHHTHPLHDLATIEHPPVSSLFLGYKRDQVTHPLDGFGLLVPPAEKLTALGVLFNSTLFAGRAPAGHVALTIMTGGALRPDLALLDDNTLLPLVRDDLGKLLGIRGDPVYLRRHVWPRAIPQYNLGYERFLDLITRVETQHPGLHIGGHVRDGISMPACLESGEKLAARAFG